MFNKDSSEWLWSGWADISAEGKGNDSNKDKECMNMMGGFIE